MVKAEYICCKRDIMGDIEKIKIKDLKTNESKWYTPEEIISAIRAGLITIKYIKVSYDGKIHITKKNKFTIKNKMDELEKEIKILEKSHQPEDRNNAIIKRQQVDLLFEEKYHFKKYRASDIF